MRGTILIRSNRGSIIEAERKKNGMLMYRRLSIDSKYEVEATGAGWKTESVDGIERKILAGLMFYRSHVELVWGTSNDLKDMEKSGAWIWIKATVLNREDSLFSMVFEISRIVSPSLPRWKHQSNIIGYQLWFAARCSKRKATISSELQLQFFPALDWTAFYR